jgi:hypothetical protein
VRPPPFLEYTAPGGLKPTRRYLCRRRDGPYALGLLAFDYCFVMPIYSLTTNIWELPRFLLFALLPLFAVLLSAA